MVLASGDVLGLRKILFLGTFGGFVFGVLGAGIATLIVVIEPIRNATLNPFGHVSACTLSKPNLDATATYFVLTAWQWPFTFASNAFQGFAIGLGDFPMFGFVMLARSLTQFVLIITAFKSSASLGMLGGIRVGSAALGLVLWCLACTRAGMRKRLRLTDAPVTSVLAPDTNFFADPSIRNAAKDGLCAMACELCVEMARTITLFVTARSMGVAAFYQVSTHYTLQMMSGLGLAEGIFMNIKLQGAKFMAAGLHYHFLWFFEFVSFVGLIISISSFIGTYASIRSITLTHGLNACVFLSEESCLLEYGNFFGGHSDAIGSTILETVFMVPPVIMVRIAYRTCRSTLYCLQDFAWMVKVSVMCFFVCFIPGVVLLAALSKSAVASIWVMSIPNIIVFGCFAWRLKWHLKALQAGSHKVFKQQATPEPSTSEMSSISRPSPAVVPAATTE
eukprot:TRINITY_DN12750_c0_g5_i1.p1 TRINITY_DN12750_c0_g5~~TRINITY_DN12750_c0_g5_i1.p1  ORF type:complete len:448 (+),score=49.14 TRINITY_DN12750_c0_g5_i1:184-1527(+)